MPAQRLAREASAVVAHVSSSEWLGLDRPARPEPVPVHPPRAVPAALCSARNRFPTMTKSLYERLGGAPKVAAIARDIVQAHLANPLIKTRFEIVDTAKLEANVRDFIGMGTGGSERYAGRDMPTAHKGMNVNERELIAAIDDVLKVLDKHGVGEGERREMLAILYSLKDEVMFK